MFWIPKEAFVVAGHLWRRAAKVDPLAQAGREALDALRHQKDVVAHQAAQRHGVNGTV